MNTIKPKLGRRTRGKGRKIKSHNGSNDAMGIQLVDEPNPVLTYMPKEQLEDRYFKKIWDLGEEVKRFIEDYHGDGFYIEDADLLTVILNLVDKLRDEALELSVRPVDELTPKVQERIQSILIKQYKKRSDVFTDEKGRMWTLEKS